MVKNLPTVQEIPSSIPGWGRSAGEEIGYPLQDSWASLVAQTVKTLPAMQETWVQRLGWEDALEEDMATHSSITISNVRSKLPKTRIKPFWWLPVTLPSLSPSLSVATHFLFFFRALDIFLVFVYFLSLPGRT